jgi:hypothetical protein
MRRREEAEGDRSDLWCLHLMAKRTGGFLMLTAFALMLVLSSHVCSAFSAPSM